MTVMVLTAAGSTAEDKAWLSLNGLSGVTAAATTSEQLLALDWTEPAAMPTRDTYVVLHDSGLGTDREEGLYKVLAHLQQGGVRAAVLFGALVDDDLKKAAFLPNVDLAIEIDDDFDLSSALTMVALRIATLASGTSKVDSGSLRIGSKVAVRLDAGIGHKTDFGYREAGFRSLVPLDGSQFARELRDVIAALKEYPLRTHVPWHPQDAAEPTLQDYMWGLVDDKDKRKLEHFGPKAKQYRAKDVRALLEGGHSGDSAEDRQKWESWRARWENRKPPLLLLTGETGVGKSLMAEFITFILNPRGSEGGNLGSRERLVKFNGAGLTLRDFDHYLMGTAPGYWTDITDPVVGLFTRAAHGVFFLDEIGDMASDVQAAFLTFLDTREIRPNGVPKPFPGFQHIIAATNHDLEEDVRSEQFRKDLLARFALRLRIPSLAQRKADLEQFIDYLAQDPVVNPRMGDGAAAELEVVAFSSGALKKLKDRDYANGNFRELTTAVHEAIRRARRRLDRVVDAADVPDEAELLDARGVTR